MRDVGMRESRQFLLQPTLERSCNIVWVLHFFVEARKAKEDFVGLDGSGLPLFQENGDLNLVLDVLTCMQVSSWLDHKHQQGSLVGLLSIQLAKWLAMIHVLHARITGSRT